MKFKVWHLAVFGCLMFFGGLRATVRANHSTLPLLRASALMEAAECQGAIDIAFVVDSSGSIESCIGCAGNFGKVRAFAHKVVDAFVVQPEATRFSVIDFSGSVTNVLELSGDIAKLRAAIDSMPYLDANTATHFGFREAAKEFLLRGRTGVNRVILLITDGDPDDPDLAVAEARANIAAGTRIFSIGVGPRVKRENLERMASIPTDKHVFSVESFDGLAAILQQLIVEICPPARANLAVTKTAQPDRVTVGGALSYTVTVRNHGPQSATGVVLTDLLPAGVIFSSVRTTHGMAVHNAGKITWQMATLASGASAELTILVSPTGAGEVCNAASVTANEPDPDESNNQATLCMRIDAPAVADLALSKTAFPDVLTPGGNLTFVLTVTNHGPGTATEVMLTDALPEGATLVAIDAAAKDCSVDKHLVSCSLGALLPASSATVTLTIKPAEPREKPICQNSLDLVLVLDGSNSIRLGAFDTMKDFARQIVDSFNVGPAGAHVGVVQFSHTGSSSNVVALSGDPLRVRQAIENMQQIRGGTDIAEGLTLGVEQLRNGRPQAPKVILLITDGRSDERTDPVGTAGRIKAGGITIFAIGIGDSIARDQLNAIASPPTTDHVFTVETFDSLRAILETLVVRVCPEQPGIETCNSASVKATQTDPSNGNNSAKACSTIIPEIPRLFIERLAGMARISWPSWAVGFRLQSTTNLVAPSQWSDTPETPVETGGRFMVVHEAAKGLRFYRLIRP